MRKNATLTVDKNWLHAPGAESCQIIASNTLLFTYILFYELLTTSPDKMAHCFRNLLDFEESLRLIPNLGRLLRYEGNTQEPCTPFLERRFTKRIRISPRTGIPDYPFTDDHRRVIEEERQQFEVNAFARFREMSAVTHGWFPQLTSMRMGGSREELDKVIVSIATNEDMIRDIFDSIRRPPMPPARSIGPDWAHFRWIQVRLLAGVDFEWRYGVGNPKTVGKKLVNQFLDLEYLTVATLSGGFLTLENRLKEWFRLLCPEGVLLPEISKDVEIPSNPLPVPPQG